MREKYLVLTKYAVITAYNRNGLLVPSAFLPETNSNRIFVINSTQLDSEREVGEFKGVDNTKEKKKSRYISPVTVYHNRKHLDLSTNCCY